METCTHGKSLETCHICFIPTPIVTAAIVPCPSCAFLRKELKNVKELAEVTMANLARKLTVKEQENARLREWFEHIDDCSRCNLCYEYFCVKGKELRRKAKEGK
jgi:hypothetical protein